MKAGIYLGKEAVEIRELELPEVGDDDVLVQNLYSSICEPMWLCSPMAPTPATRSMWGENSDTKPSPAS